MATPIIEQPLIWDGTPFAVPCDGERNVESKPAVLAMGQAATLRVKFFDSAAFSPAVPPGVENAVSWRFELRDRPGADFTVLYATSAVTPGEKRIDVAAANTLTDELEAALGERASGVFPAMLSGFDANDNRVFTACFPLCVANTTESEAVPVGADSLSKQVKALDGRVTDLEEHQKDVDDVLFFDTKENPAAGQTAFPLYGEDGKIYGAKDTGRLYRWDTDGEDYVQVGGGDAPVTSVNGKTGAVVLSASDVGAASNTALANHVGDSVKHVTAAERASWNGKMPGSATGENIPIDDSHMSISNALASVAERFSNYRTALEQGAIDSAQNTAIAAKYTKPSGGIPASDLASGVIPSVPVKAVKRNGTSLVPDANGAVNVEVPTTLPLISPDGDTTAVATNDGTVEVTHGGGYDDPIEDWYDLAEAVGLTMSDNLTPDDIRNELGLPTTATIQEAIDAALNLSWTRSLAFQDAIAAPFSATTAYAVGALCMRYGMLYECTTAHAAGAWNASHFKKRTVVQKMPDISGKANIADLRYKLVSQTVRFDNGYVVDIEDRAINKFSHYTGSAGHSIKLLLPPKVDGYARYFIVRYVVTGGGFAYELALPQTETIDIGSDFNSEIREGVNVVLFTEISDNHWLVGVKGAES